MIKMLGRPLADDILAEVKEKIDELCEEDYPPVLDVICSDTNQPYYKGIVKDAAYCGIQVNTYHNAEEWVKAADWLDNGDGVICLTGENIPAYCKCLNLDGGDWEPCTAEAIIDLLKYYDIPIEGANAVVIGRSKRVGKPVARLLTLNDATVTLCHSKTKHLPSHVRMADIIISCAGNAELDKTCYIRPDQVVVDVGGDFIGHERGKALAPAVGGVGPVTRAVLMRHVVKQHFE